MTSVWPFSKLRMAGIAGSSLSSSHLGENENNLRGRFFIRSTRANRFWRRIDFPGCEAVLDNTAEVGLDDVIGGLDDVIGGCWALTGAFGREEVPKDLTEEGLDDVTGCCWKLMGVPDQEAVLENTAEAALDDVSGGKWALVGVPGREPLLKDLSEEGLEDIANSMSIFQLSGLRELLGLTIKSWSA